MSHQTTFTTPHQLKHVRENQQILEEQENQHVNLPQLSSSQYPPTKHIRPQRKQHLHTKLQQQKEVKEIFSCCDRSYVFGPKIECDVCTTWIHMDCANISSSLANEINRYVCSDCTTDDLKTTYSRKAENIEVHTVTSVEDLDQAIECLSLKIEKEKGSEVKCCKSTDAALNKYIGCDICLGWFHMNCVNVKSDEAKQIDSYVCDSCTTDDRKTTYFKTPGNITNPFIVDKPGLKFIIDKQGLQKLKHEVNCRVLQNKEKGKKINNAQKKHKSVDAVIIKCCGKFEVEGDFCIQCEICDEWFHTDCINLTHEETDEINIYVCLPCTTDDQKTTYYDIKKWSGAVIVDKRELRDLDRDLEYRIRWKNCGAEHDSWRYGRNIPPCFENKVVEYEDNLWNDKREKAINAREEFLLQTTKELEESFATISIDFDKKESNISPSRSLQIKG